MVDVIQLLNSFSMAPGVWLACNQLFHSPSHMSISPITYLIVIVFAMNYHNARALSGSVFPQWAHRLDVTAQQLSTLTNYAIQRDRRTVLGAYVMASAFAYTWLFDTRCFVGKQLTHVINATAILFVAVPYKQTFSIMLVSFATFGLAHKARIMHSVFHVLLHFGHKMFWKQMQTGI